VRDEYQCDFDFKLEKSWLTGQHFVARFWYSRSNFITVSVFFSDYMLDTITFPITLNCVYCSGLLKALSRAEQWRIEMRAKIDNPCSANAKPDEDAPPAGGNA
jgi:hypothetical protein